jgi:transposase-like protein
MARGALIDGPHVGDNFRGYFVIDIDGDDQQDMKILVECERCGSERWVLRNSLIKRNPQSRCAQCRRRTDEEAGAMKKGGRSRITDEIREKISEDRRAGLSMVAVAKKYNVCKASVERIDGLEKAKQHNRDNNRPSGTQYAIGPFNYKIGVHGLVFAWSSEFSEWIRNTMTPSELERDGERVG